MRIDFSLFPICPTPPPLSYILLSSQKGLNMAPGFKSTMFMVVGILLSSSSYSLGKTLNIGCQRGLQLTNISVNLVKYYGHRL